jgi:hypothetical protein
MKNETINIPLRVTYRIVDGEPVRVSEERADVPLEAIVKLFAQAFGLQKAVEG